MEIDWITVTAQIVNFLILVWLLNRFLFRPVRRALAARAEAVRAELDAAADARRAADEEAARHRRAVTELEGERDGILGEAKAEAAEIRRELVETAHAEIEAAREDWRDQLAAEKSDFLIRLRRLAAETFSDLLRRTLMDMADETLVERLARVFLRRLDGLDEETAAEIRSAAARSGGLRVTTPSDLPDDLRVAIEAKIAEVTGSDASLRFETDRAGEHGIVLEAGSRRVAWTLESYLDELEARIAESIENHRDGQKRSRVA